MLLRNLTIRTGQPDVPGVMFDATEAGAHVQLPQPWAAAVPRYLLSLLYPEETSLTDLARLACSSPDAAWRATFSIGSGAIRLSRSFPAHSVRLERQDNPDGEWESVAAGVADVKAQLQLIMDLPPATVADALNFVLNPLPVHTGAPSVDVDISGMLVESNADFAEVLGTGHEQPLIAGTELAEAAGIAYRNARTSEWLDDQIRSLQAKLDEHISTMNRVIDEGGELSRVATALSRLPALRPLTASERDMFTSADTRVQELRKKLETGMSEAATPDKTESHRLRLALGMLVAGVVGFAAWSVWALLSMQRHLLVVNVFPLSAALLGGLQWISITERRGLSERRGDAIERRQQRLEQDLEQLIRRRDALRRELGVQSLAEYEDIALQQTALKLREQELMAARSSETERPEYQAALRRRARLETERDERRRALGRLEVTGQPSHELELELRKAGLDPATLLWFPKATATEVRLSGRRLAQVAVDNGMMQDGALNATVLEAWRRLAVRILGRELNDLSITSEGVLHISGAETTAALTLGMSWALLDALRISLLLNFLNTGMQLPRVMLRIHSSRLHDDALAANLSAVYSSVARKVQVIRIDGI